MTHVTYNESTRDRLRELNDEIAVQLVPAMVILALIMVVGLVGNVVACFVFLFRLRMCTQHFLIVCLAVFDLLSCLVAMPAEIVDMRYFMMYDSEYACRLLRFVNHYCSFASILTLIVIAVDRYRKVCRPLSHQMSLRQTKMAVAAVLSLALAYAVPTPLLYGLRTAPTAEPGVYGRDCSINDSVRSSSFPLTYNGVLFGSFVVIFVALTVIYVRIWREMRRHNRYMARNSTCRKDSMYPVGGFVSFCDLSGSTTHSTSDLLRRGSGEGPDGGGCCERKNSAFSLTLPPLTDALGSSLGVGDLASPELGEPVVRNLHFRKNSGHVADRAGLPHSASFTGDSAERSLLGLDRDSGSSNGDTRPEELNEASDIQGTLNAVWEKYHSGELCMLPNGDAFFKCAPTRQILNCRSRHSAEVSGESERTRNIDDPPAADHSTNISTTQKQCSNTADSFKVSLNTSETNGKSDSVDDVQGAVPCEGCVVDGNFSETKCNSGTLNSDEINDNLYQTQCPECQRVNSDGCGPTPKVIKRYGRSVRFQKTEGADSVLQVADCHVFTGKLVQDHDHNPRGYRQCISTSIHTQISPIISVKEQRASILKRPSLVSSSASDFLKDNNCDLISDSHTLKSMYSGEIHDVLQDCDIAENGATFFNEGFTYIDECLNNNVKEHNSSTCTFLPALEDEFQPTATEDDVKGTACELRTEDPSRPAEVEESELKLPGPGSEAESGSQAELRMTSRSLSLRSVPEAVKTYKATVIAMSVTAVFFISFLPHLSLTTARIVFEDFDRNLRGGSLVAYNVFLRSYFINSMANPFVYGVLNAAFRAQCLGLLHKLCSCCRS